MTDAPNAPKYIPIDQCIDRRLYRVISRNLLVGVYNAETRGFIGIRNKFGNDYPFEEYHYDTGAPLGTVRPEEDLGVDLPDEIPLKGYGDLICAICRKPAEQYALYEGPPFYRHVDDPNGTDVCREQDNQYGRAFLEMNALLLDWLRPHDDAEIERLSQL